MTPEKYPNTLLTLSAHADVQKGTARTPDLTRLAVRRLLDTRRRVRALMWAARSEVVRQQLIAQRQSFG